MTSHEIAAGDDRRPARRFFRNAARIGALGGATLAICAALFLAAVDPSLLRCSTWLMPVPQGAWAPAWMLAPMVALWAMSMCFGATRWGWFARRYAEGAGRARGGRPYVLTMDFGWSLILVLAAYVLFCAAPILVAFASCAAAH
jgi:hypothetical protein